MTTRFPRWALVVLAFGFAACARAAEPAAKPTGLDSSEAEKADLRVFFLGNSYTFYWELPNVLKTLAADATPSRKLYVGKHAEGGKTFDYYWKKLTSEDPAVREPFAKKLLDPRWDVVVLQPWKDVDNDINNYAEKLIARIRQANPKARVLLYMWGDAKLETAKKHQALFEPVARKSGATLVPVAWAWASGQTARPEPERKDLAWVAADGWHPGYRRAYLTGCALYATIFQKSPVGLKTRGWPFSYIPPKNEFPGPLKLTDEDALWLQQLAWDAVRQHTTDPQLKDRP